MNFTREPIIETIISPKEGCKLLVRSSQGGPGIEEYYVDAVEVVSFGSAFFFRSMERPKAFLVPVSDYEILEVKEPRVVLKNVTHERNIKIGGGREASMRHTHREPPPEREEEPLVAEEISGSSEEVSGDPRLDKRRDRRRRRHRRPSEEQEWSDRGRQPADLQPQPQGQQKAQGGGAEDEAKVSSPMFSSLIPPPPTLISETISRYKGKEFMEEPPAKKEIVKKEEKQQEDPPSDQEPTGSESSPLNRNVTVAQAGNVDATPFASTHFSPLESGRGIYFF